MWTLTTGQVGTIVIVAALFGATVGAALRWLCDWSDKRIDQMVDEGLEATRGPAERHVDAVVAFDETVCMSEEKVEALLDMLRRSPRPIVSVIDEVNERLVADIGKGTLPPAFRRDPGPFAPDLLSRNGDPRPRRLRDMPYAEGGVVQPRRFGDKEPIVLSEGRLITDPDEMERLGLTSYPGARRYRLDRWVASDSPSTTPPTEGDAVLERHEMLDPDAPMCACTHTRASHNARGDCPGCAGPDCDTQAQLAWQDLWGSVPKTD